MATYRIQEETLTQLSDSVRGVSRKTQKMSPEDMSSALKDIKKSEAETFSAYDPESYKKKVYTVSGEFFETLFSKLLGDNDDITAFTLNDLISAIPENDFWDIYQNYGKATDYSSAFSGARWTWDTTFKPKYDMKPLLASNMFYNNKMGGELDFMLEHAYGVDLDFSNCGNISSLFSYSNFETVGTINATKTNVSTSVFVSASNLRRINKVIVVKNTSMSTWFNKCTALEHVIFEGEIGYNALNLQWSTKLDKDSITSIINCLSTETTGLTVTISDTAVETAFATEEGGHDGTASDEWIDLVESKPNWNISLV